MQSIILPSRLKAITHLITSTILCGAEHTAERGSNLSVSFQITHPAEKRLATPAGLCPLLFPNSGVGSFTFHKNQMYDYFRITVL